MVFVKKGQTSPEKIQQVMGRKGLQILSFFLGVCEKAVLVHLPHWQHQLPTCIDVVEKLIQLLYADKSQHWSVNIERPVLDWLERALLSKNLKSGLGLLARALVSFYLFKVIFSVSDNLDRRRRGRRLPREADQGVVLIKFRLFPSSSHVQFYFSKLMSPYIFDE